MKNLYILIKVTRRIANRSILFFLTFRLEMENIGIWNLIRYRSINRIQITAAIGRKIMMNGATCL